jgi:hypothetical protein
MRAIWFEPLRARPIVRMSDDLSPKPDVAIYHLQMPFSLSRSMDLRRGLRETLGPTKALGHYQDAGVTRTPE